MRVEEVCPGILRILSLIGRIESEVESRQTVLVQPLEVKGEERAPRIADNVPPASSGDHVEGIRGVQQTCDLLVHGTQGEARRPLEVLADNVLRMHSEFHALCTHITEVGVLVVFTSYSRCTDEVDEIECIALVDIQGRADPVVEQAQFHADVQFVHLLPGQVSVL